MTDILMNYFVQVGIHKEYTCLGLYTVIHILSKLLLMETCDMRTGSYKPFQI